ncbi:MAG: hypothetical protein IK129_01845 [Deltaproteobacteria bacterium]|nr:hypothetical protein [Deltaproteobacteria bacterium]
MLMTQPTASGQASKAGRTVREAHSENRADRPKNEFTQFSAVAPVFFCPEALFAPFRLQAQIVCYFSQAGSLGGIPKG